MKILRNREAGMGVKTPDQRRPEASSLIRPHPNICGNNSGEDSSAVQDRKFTCLVECSASAPQCLEFESEVELSASVSSSDYDLLYEGLQRMKCNKPKRGRSRTRRKSCRSGCTKNSAEKRGENVCRGRQAYNCAASFAGDCAAVSCCPCAILQLLILAFMVLPCVIAKRVFCHVKRKLVHFKMNADDEVGKPGYCTPPLSGKQSPQTSRGLDGSLGPKFDTHKVWWELYAAGHIGFGGLPFERD